MEKLPKPKKLFMGEMMTCKLCGKKKRSHPHIESGWTAIQVDDQVQYICPECWWPMTRGRAR